MNEIHAAIKDVHCLLVHQFKYRPVLMSIPQDSCTALLTILIFTEGAARVNQLTIDVEWGGDEWFSGGGVEWCSVVQWRWC